MPADHGRGTKGRSKVDRAQTSRLVRRSQQSTGRNYQREGSGAGLRSTGDCPIAVDVMVLTQFVAAIKRVERWAACKYVRNWPDPEAPTACRRVRLLR
jgi:hypothetical protein